MTSYKSKSGKESGVTHYEMGEKSISVKFKSGTYTYTESSCGEDTISIMKVLALAESGLSTFIAKYNPTYKYKS